MTSQALLTELQDFVQFATRRIERGNGGDSVESLVQQWRHDSEFEEAVADVRRGLVDGAQGQGKSVAETFASIRQQLGIGE